MQLRPRTLRVLSQVSHSLLTVPLSITRFLQSVRCLIGPTGSIAASQDAVICRHCHGEPGRFWSPVWLPRLRPMGRQTSTICGEVRGQVWGDSVRGAIVNKGLVVRRGCWFQFWIIHLRCHSMGPRQARHTHLAPIYTADPGYAHPSLYESG